MRLKTIGLIFINIVFIATSFADTEVPLSFEEIQAEAERIEVDKKTPMEKLEGRLVEFGADDTIAVVEKQINAFIAVRQEALAKIQKNIDEGKFDNGDEITLRELAQLKEAESQILSQIAALEGQVQKIRREVTELHVNLATQYVVAGLMVHVVGDVALNLPAKFLLYPLQFLGLKKVGAGVSGGLGGAFFQTYNKRSHETELIAKYASIGGVHASGSFDEKEDAVNASIGVEIRVILVSKGTTELLFGENPNNKRVSKITVDQVPGLYVDVFTKLDLFVVGLSAGAGMKIDQEDIYLVRFGGALAIQRTSQVSARRYSVKFYTPEEVRSTDFSVFDGAYNYIFE